MKNTYPTLFRVLCLSILTFLFACNSTHGGIDITQLSVALEQAKAGDTIILNSGTWADVALSIKVKGTAKAPIIIKAEENGQVILTGNSTLKIGGSYVTIEGLYFKDGVTTSKPVITFKNGEVADHCRLTACAISNYNPTDRFLKSDWITLYGKHNRIDHCTFEGKYNAGLMLAVKLSGEESQNNHHQIDHNHFLNRPRLGSNGGETVRIGTSTNSLEPAHVQFTNNYFEHCGGEVEILSVKSTENVVSGNVFYECEGVLALRHGNKNVVTNNTFIGNGKPNTGGIRVINAGHTITNNHFQDLTGFRFWSALAVMNGVPNSAINRYHQVKDVEISSNTFVNCDVIGFGIGTDGERTALPQDVIFADNVIYNDNAQEIQILDDMSGVDFKDNKTSKIVSVNQDGFKATKLKAKKDNQGLYSTTSAPKAISVEKSACGATWFQNESLASKETKTITVNSGEELQAAISEASCGDEIKLLKSETYYISEPLIVNKSLSIVSDLAVNPIVKYIANISKPLVIIAEGANLTIDGLDFAGLTEGGIPPCAISTQEAPFLTQYKFHAYNSHFYDFNAGGRIVYRATSTSYGDTVLFENCQFSNISGIAINLKGEKDDVGRYNAENVIIKNCLFYDVMGSALDLYRGGNDESTSGPKLLIDHCTFYNVENRELGASINLTGVQQVQITNCIFSESGKSGRVLKMESPRWAKCEIDYCNFYNTGRIETFYERLGDNIWHLDPQFTSIKDNNYSLKSSSRLLKKSKEGKTLGYIK